jgi:hypothetical protein
MGYSGDYRKVYGDIGQLGKLLSELSDGRAAFDELDEDQDYFLPRSLFVSDTVIKECRDKDFHRVFKKFHYEVPRFVIPRYKTFKRFGFANNLAIKAFKRWEEGEKFYLDIYTRDESFYLKQQLAIFLGRKKQYARAFRYIDEALSESQRKNMGILHTHARLMFEANIDKVGEEPTLRAGLRDSLRILEECRARDRRQNTHVMRYAIHCIKYYEVFGDGESVECLKKAVQWLREEQGRNPSFTWIGRLIKDAQRRIAEGTS